MEAITYTAARQNLAKTMEKVCRDHAPPLVTPGPFIKLQTMHCISLN